jgi:4-hydroxybenzoate polyprenyltransferase
MNPTNKQYEGGFWRAFRAIRSGSRLVVLPHSVFALPFALSAFVVALKQGALVPLLSPLVTLLLIVACAVSARTAAMAFNRVVDRYLDAENPRTAGREIPRGEVTLGGARALVGASSAVFLGASALLGLHCLVLAPVVLAFLFLYSYTKRFTHWSHVLLGAVLACAPAGAWWCVRPEVATTPLLFVCAVVFWVAGFDIIYSCQDVEFDRAKGLYSLPASMGCERALLLSRALHALAMLFFVLLGVSIPLAPLYFLGLVPLGAILLYQHTIVSADDLRRVNRAFFATNGVVSIAYFLLLWATLW